MCETDDEDVLQLFVINLNYFWNRRLIIFFFFFLTGTASSKSSQQQLQETITIKHEERQIKSPCPSLLPKPVIGKGASVESARDFSFQVEVWLVGGGKKWILRVIVTYPRMWGGRLLFFCMTIQTFHQCWKDASQCVWKTIGNRFLSA